ncbi:YjbQ family protein [Ruoffia tabacinasalis]|uniref:YjbQ family protein n=1 Tax=Ruoffia tabacinasalis TaxID=87458 RepID=A0ABS0LN43_9LACT|nr:YjbQ family protein [Ruoffia tabacinasalis]MBG9978839.1 YjbQ family protein [Ruoffia tabacinasalis]
MKMFKEKIELKSKGSIPTYIDITKEVRKAIEDSEVENGIVTVVSPHTTCAVFYEEYAHDENEEGVESLQQDLNNALEKIIPYHTSADTFIYPGEEHYQAVESWPNADEYLPNGDRSALWNGDAHLKATIIGSSESFDVEKGNLGVGSTGYIYFVDFDTTRSRTRKCSITVIGE